MPGPDLLSPSRTIDPSTGELWLSQLALDLRNRAVHRDVGDSQAMHRRLLDAFPPGMARADHGLLYRIEPDPHGDRGQIIALVQSTIAPDWSHLPAGYLQGDGWLGTLPEPKPIGERYRALNAGDVLRFRLRANPAKKIHTTEETKTPGKRPTGPNGTRKPLTRDELPAWLERKAQQHGFRLLDARNQPDPISGKEQAGHKTDPQDIDKKMRMTHAAVLFDGELEITDADLFRDALWGGIGPAKAYGFGLLSIALIGKGEGSCVPWICGPCHG
jgi:CRISPR system Cascade subunit CasE